MYNQVYNKEIHLRSNKDSRIDKSFFQWKYENTTKVDSRVN